MASTSWNWKERAQQLLKDRNQEAELELAQAMAHHEENVSYAVYENQVHSLAWENQVCHVLQHVY